MPSLINLTLHEGNDETVSVTIVPASGGSLAGVTGLEMVLKPSTCEDDDDDDALVLTTGNGIVLNSQSADLITATITIPATALTETYERAWRLDALTGSARRTALYGAVTVIDL